jgi:hypothetical protein
MGGACVAEASRLSERIAMMMQRQFADLPQAEDGPE